MIYLGAEGLQCNLPRVQLKEKLKICWAEIDSEAVRATCNQVISRLRRVIKEKGGYVK